jgi:ABC-type multidrug transport system fused ATPase/permease subunit
VNRQLLLSSNLSKFEEGIGEKVATFIYFESIFVSGIITALVLGWKLALICIVSLPVSFTVTMIVSWVSNTFHPTIIRCDQLKNKSSRRVTYGNPCYSIGSKANSIYFLNDGMVYYDRYYFQLSTKFSRQEMEAYGAAGSIAEEVLSSIRTVVAFAGQEKEIARYEKHLQSAKRNNITKNLFSGISNGFMWFFVYASYALSFWYGVGLILDERYLPKEEIIYTPANMVAVCFTFIQEIYSYCSHLRFSSVL